MRQNRTGRFERYNWFAAVLIVCLTVMMGWFPVSAAVADGGDADSVQTVGVPASAQDDLDEEPGLSDDEEDPVEVGDYGDEDDDDINEQDPDNVTIPDVGDEIPLEGLSLAVLAADKSADDAAGTETNKENSTGDSSAASEQNGVAGQTVAVQETAPAQVEKQLQVKVTSSGKKYKKTMRIGNRLRLSVIKGSAQAALTKCRFSSSKKSVATVSKKGIIKARKKGTAVITVKYKKRKAKITVKVKKAESTDTDSSSGDASDADSESASESGISGSVRTMKGAPGKRTIKAYLQNALVPCGRTLYIYGGGWGNYGAKIGYQSSWRKHFEAHAGSNYNSNKYRFKRSKGLDCSGFAGWTIYNTLYSKSKKHAGLACSSSTVAKTYASKGWATLVKNSSSKTFKPGDVVSQGGHVWISMGQCADKSVVLIHSTPHSGVQISGTKGKAADLAKHYMKKYFPKWPYKAKQMGSSYWRYRSRARWKVKGSGSILSDPDGIQNMSAEQALRLLLGK